MKRFFAIALCLVLLSFNVMVCSASDVLTPTDTQTTTTTPATTTANTTTANTTTTNATTTNATTTNATTTNNNDKTTVSKTTKKSSNSTKTGDNTPYFIIALAMIASAIAICLIVWRDKIFGKSKK